MFLSDVSIKRPVFTVILSSVLLLFGALGYSRLGVDLMPKVEAPFVSVSVVYRGADPDVVENRVIKPIEDAVSSISGVKKVTAMAVESYGLVFIEFELSVKADRAAQDVRDRVAKVQADLPADADTPVIEKMDIGAVPVVALVLTGPATDSVARMSYIADEKVRPQLQRLDGVGVVDVVGKQTREIHVVADPERLRSYGLTLLDLQQSIGASNVDLPGGRITTRGQELLVKAHGEAASLDELRAMIVAGFQGAPVRLGDVAQIVDSAEDARTKATFDGLPALTLLVRKQSDANSVAVADRVLAALKSDKIAMPAGYKMEVAQNSSTFTRHAIDDVVFDLIFGAILAVFVILLFLRDARATFISALALPTSVVGTFAFMRAMDFTMNNLSMLALSLSVGMLIDDAIVVIENIHRHLEMGKPPMQAAREGTAEIGLAVLATTLSVVAVFVPVAFMEGMAGRFFYEFGLTVTFAILVSLFVSFTLTPMAASRMLRKHHEGAIARFLGRGLDALDRGYRGTIGWVLSHRFVTITAGALTLAAALVLAGRIPKEFQSAMDQGELDVAFQMDEGASLDVTTARGAEIEKIIRERAPELRHVLLTVGAGTTKKVNEGKLFLKLTGRFERERGQVEIAADLRKAIAARYPDLSFSVSQAAMAGQASGEFMAKPLNLQLRGDDSVELRGTAQKLVERLQQEKGFVDLTVSDRGVRPQFGFSLDREKVSAAGLAPVQVQMAIRTAINGTEVSQFREGTDRYDVVLRAPDRYREQEAAVLGIALRGPMGNLVEVGELVNTATEDAAAQINRENRVRQVTITGNLEGLALGPAQDRVAELAPQIVPPTVKLAFAGQGEIMIETFRNMMAALLLAVILVYMVLAAQFESFLHPLTIMASLPLSLVGALGGLFLMGQTLSIFSFIGIIMLMGLVTKNAILLVDNANQRREQGTGVTEALAEAGATRLRPILMTTGAMVFGMLPVAMALGEGSEQRAPMGVAVIGGLLTSTLLTLFVVPAIYSAAEGAKARLGIGRKGAGAAVAIGNETPDPAVLAPPKAEGKRPRASGEE